MRQKIKGLSFMNIMFHLINNYVNGKHIILLNNDIEIITSNWIEEMHSQRQEIGCVGANDTIQHAGVIIGIVIKLIQDIFQD